MIARGVSVVCFHTGRVVGRPETRGAEMIQAAFALRIKPMRQLDRVRIVLESRGWSTLDEIAGQCRARWGKLDTPAAISARIRELPHEKRRRGGKGQLYEYRLLP